MSATAQETLPVACDRSLVKRDYQKTVRGICTDPTWQSRHNDSISGSWPRQDVWCITRADPFLRLHRVVELDAGIATAGTIALVPVAPQVSRPTRWTCLGAVEPGIQRHYVSRTAWDEGWLRFSIWCALMSQLQVTLMARLSDSHPCFRSSSVKRMRARVGKAKAHGNPVSSGHFAVCPYALLQVSISQHTHTHTHTNFWAVQKSDDMP